MSEILFYFDFISPYAYLAWRDARARGMNVKPMPVVFAALLEHGGTLGPAEIPAKRRFLIHDCIRRADALGVPFVFPPRHPFRSLDALRAAIDRPPEVIDRLFAACWVEGRDLSDPTVLKEALHPLPLPEDPSLKERLKKQTDEAIARGVFGVPTFVVNGELVWGSDRIEDAVAIARGERLVDPARAEKMIATPAAVVRRGPRVQQLFDRAAFMQWLGVQVDSIETGMVKTSLEVRPDHRQQDGFVHAGVITTLADHSAGAAAGTQADRPLTIELKINLLRPAKGPKLSCRSTVLKAGRTITVAESEVYDGATLVAKATVTLAVTTSSS